MILKLPELLVSTFLSTLIVSILIGFILKFLVTGYNLLDRLDSLYDFIVIEQSIREDLRKTQSLKYDKHNYKNRLILTSKTKDSDIAYYIKQNKLYRDNYVRAEAIVNNMAGVKLDIEHGKSSTKYTILVDNLKGRELVIVKVI